MLRARIHGTAAALALMGVAAAPRPAAPAAAPVQAPAFRMALVRPIPSGSSDFGVALSSLGEDALIGGYTESGGIDSGLLLRVGPTGDEVWRRELPLGGDGAVWSIRPTGAGVFAGAGWSKSAAGDRDAMLVRFDASGTIRGSTSYPAPHQERLWSLAVADGGILAVGEAVEADGASRGFVLKSAFDGREIDRFTVTPAAPAERLFAIAPVSGSGFVVAGQSGSGPREGPGFDARIVRCDAEGKIVWSRSWGGSGYDVAHDLKALAGGGYLATGYTDAGPGRGTDVFLLRLSPEGEVIWTRTYGGPGDDRAVHLDLLPDGRAAIVGYSRSAADWDLVLRVVDAYGAPIREERLGGTGNEIGRAVAAVADGGLAVVGHSQSYGPLERILFARLTPAR